MRYLRHASLALLLAYASFTVARLIFYIFQAENFSSATGTELVLAFCAGLLLDTPPIFYYHLLFLLLVLLPLPAKNKSWYQPIVQWSFVIPSAIALQQNLADAVYFSYAKKRTGKEIFELIGHSKNVLLDYLLDYWMVPLLMIPLVWMIYFFYKKINWPTTEWNRKTILQHTGLFLVCVPLVVLGLRGGLFLKPLSSQDAAKFVDPSLLPLTVSTPMQMISSVSHQDMPRYRFMSDEEAIKIIGPNKSYTDGPLHLPSGSKLNVVLIIVESLDKEYIGYFNQGRGYTPFFDSLCTVSLVFPHGYATGTTSMDAPPGILSSIPHLMGESYISSAYNVNRIESIGSHLKAEGYHCSFYHGGANGTMNFNSFIAVSGSGDYFGKNEYPRPEDEDGAWGIPDEPYLQYFAQQLNQEKGPFFGTVFTLSSHHPYLVPEKYAQTLPKGSMPIHQAVAYTDLSLKKFFETAERMPWFNNTLFVITADHASITDQAYYQTPEGDYTIPLLFYMNEKKLEADTNRTVSHLDIYPSILNVLQYPRSFYSLGQSVFDRNTSGISVTYRDGSYQVIRWPWVLQSDLKNTTRLYNLQQDHFMKSPVVNEKITGELSRYLKALVQVYSEGVRNNTLRLLGK